MMKHLKPFTTKPKDTEGISIIKDIEGVKFVLLHNEIKGFYRHGKRCGVIYGNKDTWLEIPQKYLNVVFDDWCKQNGFDEKDVK